jgi:hypothetical protein
MLDFSDYKPMSEEEAQKARFSLMNEGEYEGIVTKWEAQISASGNKMAVIFISIMDSDGLSHSIRDYLVYSPNMMWKIKHAAESAGLGSEFEAGKFMPSLLVSRSVTVKIKIDPGKEIPADKLNGKPAGSKYPDKNAIEDYVPAPLGYKAPVQPVAAQAGFDDDIPF